MKFNNLSIRYKVVAYQPTDVDIRLIIIHLYHNSAFTKELVSYINNYKYLSFFIIASLYLLIIQ